MRKKNRLILLLFIPIVIIAYIWMYIIQMNIHNRCVDHDSLSAHKPMPVEDVGMMRGGSTGECIKWFNPGVNYSTIFYSDHILIYSPKNRKSTIVKPKPMIPMDTLPCCCLIKCKDGYLITSDDSVYIVKDNGELINPIFHVDPKRNNVPGAFLRIYTDAHELEDGSLLLAGIDDFGSYLFCEKLDIADHTYRKTYYEIQKSDVDFSFTGKVKFEDDSVFPLVTSVKNSFVCFGELSGNKDTNTVTWVAEDLIVLTDKEIQNSNFSSIYSRDAPYDLSKRYPFPAHINIDELISVSHWCLITDEYCIIPYYKASVSENNSERDYQGDCILLNKYRKVEGKYVFDSEFKVFAYRFTTEDLKRAAAFYADIQQE